ncbi:MAG: hypothetical protein FJ271_17365 [Planctomycetes bacterium]|nr:hypothetical protein [Planctomycetota bacterium]
MSAIESAVDFFAVRRQHRLLEPSQLAEVEVQLVPRFREAKGLARELAQRGWLTPFQVNELILGRGQQLTLGAYVLQERLGEGGMGTVFKARQRSLGRVVALKVIRKDRVVNPQTVKRFQREIRAAAQLNHPNIVRAFDADEIDGTHLLVMEYVENGTDLSKLVKRDGPLPIAVACDYIRQAALGLQHAHERGMVHRDIKPANLLLQSPTRERVGMVSLAHASGSAAVVKILDMGLARLDHAEDEGKSSTSLTGEGAVMGTIDYIAPEQAMDSHHADIRADLYSLGCTFYYLLTGRVPFPGGDAVGKLIRQRTEEPTQLEFLRPQVAPALASIVRTLMAKRREDRFQTPGELAAQLDDVMKKGVEVKGQRSIGSGATSSSGTIVDPKLARQWAEVVMPASNTEALVKPPSFVGAPAHGSRRRWALAGAAAALLLAVMLTWQPWRRSDQPPPETTKSKIRPPTAKELADKAERQRQDDAAEALKPIAERVAALGAGATAAGEALRNDLRAFLMQHSATPAASQACGLLGHILAKLPSPLDELDAAKIPADAKSHWKATGSIAPAELVGALGENRGRYWHNSGRVTWSPAGNLIGSGSMWIWDANTLAPRKALPGIGPAFFPDGGTLLYDDGGTLKIWDIASAKVARTFETTQDRVTGIALSGDGRWALTTHEAGVRIWNVATGKVQHVLVEKTPASFPTIAHDGRHAAAFCNRSIRAWEVPTGKEIFRYSGPAIDQGIASLECSPDGRRLLMGQGTSYLFDLADGKELHRFPNGYVACFSSNGERILAGGSDHLTYWNAHGKREVLLKFEGVPKDVMTGVTLSPDGQHALSSSRDGALRIWNVNTGKEVQPPTGPVGPIHGLAFAPGDRRLVTAGADGALRLFDLGTLTEADEPKPQKQASPVLGLVLSPDGRRAISAGIAAVWDVTGPVPQVAIELKALANCVAQSPDGKLLALGQGGGKIDIWELAEAQPNLRGTFTGHTSNVATVAFSPDGKFLASGGNDHQARLWDMTVWPPKELVVVGEGVGVSPNVYGVAFAPDGQSLAIASQRASRYKVVGKGLILASEVPGSTAVQSVAFSPSGEFLATVGYGSGHIVLWNARRMTKIREWKLPGPALQVAFANDGRHLATANVNGTVYVFRIADGLPRALSTAEAKKQQLDAAGFLAVPVAVENSVGMKLRLIPPGRFLMGSPEEPEEEPGRQGNEGPRRSVTMSRPFYLGMHEVTRAQFVKVMGQPALADSSHPMYSVSWGDAVKFCEMLSETSAEKAAGRVYRLPTEAEWEYACRAGTQTVFSFGSDQAQLGEHAWYSENDEGGKTHPVGLKKANAWGLYDMHGNVWEWCADSYQADYYREPAAPDPPGPTTGTGRVYRGGARNNSWTNNRCATRNRDHTSEDAQVNIGFRIVCAYRPPQIENSIGMKLARIPAGKFLMGSLDNEPGRKPDEGPQHEVTIRKPFLIGVHEVTQQQYEQVVGTNPAEFNKASGGGPDHPVESVSWSEAVAFCKSLSDRPAEKKAGRVYRLPTEAEWEYAYRAGTRSRFPFGDAKVADHAWSQENADGKTHAVARLKPNPWGLFDMGGNVWEFAADYYDAAGYPPGPTSDPRGPLTGSMRLLRGGGFDYPIVQARAAARSYQAPDKKDSAIGFRVVCD